MTQPPELAGRWEAREALAEHRGVGFTVINFNTARQTLRCLDSLAASAEPPAWVLVLDNASNAEDFHRLASGIQAMARSTVCLYRSEVNLGFAAGSNFLVDMLLAQPQCRFLGLLNNDAVAMPAMVSRLADALAADPRGIGLSGGRMHKLHHPQEVDTLGITLYASLMPADRKSTADPYLGPTGGCCLMDRQLVLQLKAASGYCFDPRYFCYCEDTDLVLRTVLLGYWPAYVDEVIALHEGQASSGGGYNPFIAYHGLRNTMWMHLKLMPLATLLLHGPWLLLAHVLSVGRHLAAGHIGLLISVYRDALAQRGPVLAERMRFQQHVRISRKALHTRFAPRFYRTGYFGQVLRQLADHYRQRFGKRGKS